MTAQYKRSIGILLLAAIFSFSLFQCSYNKNSAASPEKLSVKEPFEKIKIEPGTYLVDGTKGGDIQLPNGTKITVPANAFVDKDGKPVTGPVEIKYREFHTAADILVSGIPMKYMEGDKEYDFESAGMFEIEGYSALQEVDIADGKQINVQMASFKKDENYNHYYFDDEKGQWLELEKAVKPQPVEKKTVSTPMSSPEGIITAPVAPVKLDPNATVLNIDADYTKYPYLKDFNGLLWQYAGTDPANDPKNIPWLKKEEWNSVSLEMADAENSLFTLTVSAGKKKYEALVAPALKGKSYEKAFAGYQAKLQQYQAQQALIQQAATVMQGQAEIVRAFAVNKFGVYNCDRYLGNENLFALKWRNELENGSEATALTIYHVCKTTNTLVQYWPGKEQFLYDPSKENILLVVLPGDKIAVVERNEFEKIKASHLQSGSDYTFRFRTLDQTFASAADIDQLVKGL